MAGVSGHHRGLRRPAKHTLRRGSVGGVQTTLERLGRPPHGQLLLVTCDGFGVSHAANQGVLNALRGGIGTSASLAMACPWARSAALGVTDEDIGVSLTLNAEYPAYRWGPITQSPTLLDGDGGFPRTTDDLWEHADVLEVRRECQAQLERAMQWGIDVTHLANHLDALALRPEFFGVYVDLAEDYGLPIRLPGSALEARAAFPLRRLAAESAELRFGIKRIDLGNSAIHEQKNHVLGGWRKVQCRLISIRGGPT